MPFNNDHSIGVVFNPLVYSQFSQPENEGKVAPGANRFITAENGDILETENNLLLITET